MTTYKSPEQVCEELVKISTLLPTFQIKIPLLSWEMGLRDYNAVDKLVELLTKQGLAAKRYEGGVLRLVRRGGLGFVRDIRRS